MESKFLCIQLFVILCLLFSDVYSGVLNKNEYVKDELMQFKPVNKAQHQSSPISSKNCCSGCVYIEGIGCIDPNDGTIRPKLKELLLKSNSAIVLEDCCTGCVYIAGVGCIDPNDGSIHPFVKDLLEALWPRGKCCPRCIYVPGRGCIDPSDPGVHPPFLV